MAAKGPAAARRRSARTGSSSLRGAPGLADVLEARKNGRRICSPGEIAAAVERMADAIRADLEQTNPVLLAVMHGGVFAAVELSRRLGFPHEFDYVHVTRYAGGTRGGKVEWRVPPSARLAGRTVLVVDDVLDRGHTLRALSAKLRRIGVAAQRTAVLVVKRVARPANRPRVDYVGVEVEDVYVFGCGMDYRGYWRGLPALYALASGHVERDGD
jgi:hypoxanthine phosphoribosyltransferase